MPEVKNLSVDCLYQHPDNPRKDLGDLSELAGSIKASGILQNLTVIPAMQVEAVWKQICTAEPVPQEAYVVIIGHRRLAAAKQAGLTEVPCTITSMTPQEQIRTMLMENMQRAELTPYEQAMGFQLMLNMGDTVETIARDSGFSESTVRRRVNLLKFKDETFRAATEKQISLDTLSEVAKIENAKKRDAVLASYGTNNFPWDLQSALTAQEAKKRAPAAKAEILSYATEIKKADYNKFDHVMSVRFADYTPGSAIPKTGTKGEFFVVFGKDSAAIYKKSRKAPAKKKSAEEQAKEAEVKRRETELKDLTETAFKLRRDFAANLTVGKADYPKLLKQACRALIACKTLYYGSNFVETFSAFMGLEKSKDPQMPKEVCQWLMDELDRREPVVTPLVGAILAAYGDSDTTGYWQRSYGGALPRHFPNSGLNLIYEFLGAFGYEMSDVEKSLKDGTHPLLAENPKQKETASDGSNIESGPAQTDQ